MDVAKRPKERKAKKKEKRKEQRIEKKKNIHMYYHEKYIKKIKQASVNWLRTFQKGHFLDGRDLTLMNSTAKSGHSNLHIVSTTTITKTVCYLTLGSSNIASATLDYTLNYRSPQTGGFGKGCFLQ